MLSLMPLVATFLFNSIASATCQSDVSKLSPVIWGKGHHPGTLYTWLVKVLWDSKVKAGRIGTGTVDIDLPGEGLPAGYCSPGSPVSSGLYGLASVHCQRSSLNALPVHPSPKHCLCSLLNSHRIQPAPQSLCFQFCQLKKKKKF